ncbi:MAG: GNAT family N-acetyltransferase [Pseudomonadota bacterium]|nr:GNAT family N-acetyltransferase [Pseudomonadota bacterium]
MSAIRIAIIPHASPAYEQARLLRERILRLPLGCTLSEKDTEGEEAQIHIAAMDDASAVIGTLLLKPLPNAVVKFRQMAVDSAMQRAGLGRKLVAFAEQTARERGFAFVELNARMYAAGFYEKLGYAAEGEPFTEVALPHIRMTKRL